MSSLFKSILGVAAPILGNMILPGIGGVIGGALGGGVSGGGLKGIALGGLAGGLSGGLGTPASSISWTSAAPGYSLGSTALKGSGILGGISKFSPALARGISSVATGLKSTGLDGFGSSAAKSVLGGLADGAPDTSYNTDLDGLPSAANSIFSGLSGYNALGEAAKSQIGANSRALAAVSPFSATGTQANDRIGELMGLSDNDPEKMRMALESMPGYQFRVNQGENALNRSLASRGDVFSGRALAEANQMGQGYADQAFNQYISQLQGTARQGQGAAADMAQLYDTQGDIRANRDIGRADIINRSLADLLNPYRRKVGN